MMGKSQHGASAEELRKAQSFAAFHMVDLDNVVQFRVRLMALQHRTQTLCCSVTSRTLACPLSKVISQ